MRVKNAIPVLAASILLLVGALYHYTENKTEKNLKHSFHKSHGVPPRAFYFVQKYRKAADQGDASAENNLGYSYNYGQGVSQSYTKAVYWYRKAAYQGYADAEYNLGLSYNYGEPRKTPNARLTPDKISRVR